jgi:hypothetical protein
MKKQLKNKPIAKLAENEKTLTGYGGAEMMCKKAQKALKIKPSPKK